VVDAHLLVPAAVLWVLLPAYVANATATLPRGWGAPMDFGRSWPADGRRLFGPSKTWSGFLCGTSIALAVGLLEAWLRLIAPPDLRLVPAFGPSLLAAIPVVLLLAAGALTGDALGSFLKRRRNIPPGGALFPLDQLLFVAVPLLAGLALFPSVFASTFLGVEAVLWTLLFTVGLHVLFNFVGFKMGLKKVPW
jgi:CDP-2,3-bis-(O-geranylgeranyl)-sn-glycerol synthase